MLRNLLSIGVVAILGLFVLKIAFGILGPLVGLLMLLLGLALKIALVAVLIYFVLRVFSPSTASRIRSKFERSR